MIWTARLAVGCYLAGVCASMARSGARPGRGECILWTAGCALLWVHIPLALGVVHGWSVEAAYRHTAERTVAVTGWDWGGGLYVNFSVAALWLLDVAWMWRWRAGGAVASRFWTRGVQAVLGFVVLNATVVFGPRCWWWVAAGFVALLLSLRLIRMQQHRDRGPPTG